MISRKKLTPKRQRILVFIRQFYEENGLPPTVRDIQRACNISSTSVVDYNIRILQRDGYLHRRPDVARGIELLDESGSPRGVVARVPLMGYIAAGEALPILTEDSWTPPEALETIELPSNIVHGYQRLYALKVRGTSMIDALIDDGDVVLVEPVGQVKDGDMVIAWLKREKEATLKRLYQEGGEVRLQPANSQMEPIRCEADNVEVQGKVVGVIRMFR